jgi:hypothetical protein
MCPLSCTIRARLDGTFDVDYDDGEQELKVPEDLIRAKDGAGGGGGKASRALEAGDKVEGNYRGKGKWYPGKIKRVRLDGTYDIEYNDGESETAVAADLVRAVGARDEEDVGVGMQRRKPQIEEGSKVEANYRGKGKYYPGRVKRVRSDGTYDVDYNDGEQELRVSEDMIRLVDAGGSPSRAESSSASTKRKLSLEEGMKVEANYKGRGRWFPGVIKRYGEFVICELDTVLVGGSLVYLLSNTTR